MSSPSDVHEHVWMWQHFVVIAMPENSWRQATGYGIKTCDCGSIELVDADYGQTPEQAIREAEVDARKEAAKAKRKALKDDETS